MIRGPRAGIWTIQSGVFPENVASLALHTRMGFRVVGGRRRSRSRLAELRDGVEDQVGSAV